MNFSKLRKTNETVSLRQSPEKAAANVPLRMRHEGEVAAVRRDEAGGPAERAVRVGRVRLRRRLVPVRPRVRQRLKALARQAPEARRTVPVLEGGRLAGYFVKRFPVQIAESQLSNPQNLYKTIQKREAGRK